MALKIIVLSIYGLMVIFFGLLGLRKTKSFEDFFLGGRSIGPWMTAFTYGTAYFSAVLFIGFAGNIGWGFGLSGLWVALGNSLIGVFCVWWLIGPKIRIMSEEYKVATMPEFLEKRFDSRFLKLFASIAIFVFFVPYTSAVFMGLSYLFTSNFNIDYTLALVLMGGFTAIYLVLGGYKSMTMIDVVFGIIMTAGVFILLWSILDKADGLANIIAKLKEINPKLVKSVGPPGFWPLFSLVFLTSVAPFGMPQLIQKFYAIKDKRSIRIGMYASTGFALIITGIAYFTGATTRFFLSPETTPAAFANGKPLVDALMPEIIANVVPGSLSVLMLLLILSASMSTLAALILISSSSVVKDLYAGFINKGSDDNRLTLLMRVISAVFILLAVILAYFKPATIVSILGVSWGAIGAVFLGPFIWGLFTKWVSKTGAITGSALGLGVCMFLYLRGISSPQAGTIGMMVSLATPPLISLIFRSKKRLETRGL
ncbi:sodium/solute symporter [bacterium]|nr:sodium/solute symporter [bacterium]